MATCKSAKKSGKAKRFTGKQNRFQTVDGWFDSKGEWQRWVWLRAAESAGNIKDLKRQVVFHLDVAGVHICDYVADYTYTVIANGPRLGLHVVEDYKGPIVTDVFKLKAKLMKGVHGIDVRISKSPTEWP